jgi:nucleotide-binding universal stress UspA family protein
MPYTVVVGTDGSPEAERAVMVAADLARTYDDAMVHVVAAIDAVPIEIPVAMLATVEDEWERAANDAGNHALERAASLVRDRGVAVSTHVMRGGPASCLQHKCQDVGADLLVVGKHGTRWDRNFLVGSTAERCVRHAPCSVLVVTPEPPR